MAMASTWPKRRRRPVEQWRSPSFVDITNVESFAHPKGGAKAAAERAAGRRLATATANRRVRTMSNVSASAAPRDVHRGGATSSTPDAPFTVGDKVNALYSADGTKYPATIRKVYRSKLQYLVDWADGDSSHRTVRFKDVSARSLKGRRAAQTAATALQQQPPTCTDGDSAADSREDKLASHQLLSVEADDGTEDMHQARWDSTRLAQLCAEVGQIPVKDSKSYWSQVAGRMQLRHGMQNARPAECQQAYASRFPTPTKRRKKIIESKQLETEDQARQAGALGAGARANHFYTQTSPVRVTEPDGVNEEASLQRDLRPPIRPPRPGTIKWKSYVRAMLTESDRDHVDDVFAHLNGDGNVEPIYSSRSAISAVKPTAIAERGNAHDPSDADDLEEEHDFLISVTEQQRCDMDGYLALLQRRDAGGSVFRGAKRTNKTRYAVPSLRQD